MNLPIKIRPIMQLDIPFLMNAWLKSFRGAFFSKDIHPNTYYGNHHGLIGELLQTCTTYVACSDTDSSEIYGFICGEYESSTFVLHYIYVKHTFRNMGIARNLLAQFPVAADGISMYTHHNAIAHKQAAAYHFLYNPYLAFLHKYRKDKTKNDLEVDTKLKPGYETEEDFKRMQARGSSMSTRKETANE